MNAFQNSSTAATTHRTANIAQKRTTAGPITYGISVNSTSSFSINGVFQPAGIKPSDLGPFPGFEDDRSNN